MSKTLSADVWVRVSSYVDNANMNRIAISCESKTMNNEECSDVDTISAAMMLFNNGYVGHYDYTSSSYDG